MSVQKTVKTRFYEIQKNLEKYFRTLLGSYQAACGKNE